MSTARKTPLERLDSLSVATWLLAVAGVIVGGLLIIINQDATGNAFFLSLGQLIAIAGGVLLPTAILVTAVSLLAQHVSEVDKVRHAGARTQPRSTSDHG